MIINTTAKDIMDISIDCLKTGTPMSHLRCGDGEVIMMNHKTSGKWFPKVSIGQYGYVIDENVADGVKKSIEFAILNSDIIGIPESRHLDANNDNHWKMLYKEYERVFDAAEKNISDVKYCSIDSHYRLLKNNELDKIIESVDKITIITCRHISKLFLHKYPHIRNIELLSTPAQQRYEMNPTKSDFFKIHDEIVEKIISKDRRGELCIFGAGVGGKDFGAHFKLAGGVSIDIGSVFDCWVGKQTRGTGKGPEARSEKYALTMEQKIPRNYVKPKDEGLKLECPWIVPDAVFFLVNLIKGHEVVLDAGMGGSTLFFARRCSNVIGMETNQEWFDKVILTAKRHGTNEKISAKVLPTQSDIEKEIDSHLDKSFDIISIDTQGKITNRHKILLHAFKKLKPNGIIIIDNYSHGNKFDTPDKLLKFFSIDKTHKITDFDDENWNGSGTRVIHPIQ